MTYATDARTPLWGLPDPETRPEFYDGVAFKRLFAFLVDSVIVGLLTAVVVLFSALTALFFLPVVAMTVGFVYRFMTIASGSATWGMRLASLELRTHRGERFDGWTALLHTALFTLFLGTLLPTLISAGLMLFTPRAQGLHDMILGTAAINRAARP